MQEKQTNLLVMGVAVVAAVLGALLLFVPQISAEKICYLMCGAVVIGGIYSIVHYFLSNAFREAQDYGFSAGVFLVVLGILGFIKTAAIVDFFPVALSVIGLLYGVILLQDALDLKRLGSGKWSIVLCVSVVVILVAMADMINPFSKEMQTKISYWLILITGVLLLGSKLILKLAYKEYDRIQDMPQVEPEKTAEYQVISKAERLPGDSEPRE